MKWLLTAPVDIDLDALRQEVEAAGATLSPKQPIPLEEREQVLRAEGPDDLNKRLGGSRMPIRVHPDSEVELY